ncbi:hypothetical protein, partial [Parvibaculum sp.]|uniref:hypothetical protein n=1 Tax=Parvibaculum sp. TaxID=2024848 RepID=UPI0025D57AA2
PVRAPSFTLFSPATYPGSIPDAPCTESKRAEAMKQHKIVRPASWPAAWKAAWPVTGQPVAPKQAEGEAQQQEEPPPE